MGLTLAAVEYSASASWPLGEPKPTLSVPSLAALFTSAMVLKPELSDTMNIMEVEPTPDTGTNPSTGS